MTPSMQPTLPIGKIVRGKNPREYFDPAEMAELEEGIRAVGVLEPIVVRPVPGTNLYEIIADERRWRAAKNVFGDGYGMPVVINDANDETAEAMSVIENYHRAVACRRSPRRTAPAPAPARRQRGNRSPHGLVARRAGAAAGAAGLSARRAQGPHHPHHPTRPRRTVVWQSSRQAEQRAGLHRGAEGAGGRAQSAVGPLRAAAVRAGL